MINKIPFFGWFFSFVGSVSLSIPFWYCYTDCGLGKLYFDFFPIKYQAIPFWDCVGLFIVLAILKGTFWFPLVNISQTNK